MDVRTVWLMSAEGEELQLAQEWHVLAVRPAVRLSSFHNRDSQDDKKGGQYGAAFYFVVVSRRA